MFILTEIQTSHIKPTGALSLDVTVTAVFFSARQPEGEEECFKQRTEALWDLCT